MDELTKKAYEKNCREIALAHLKLCPEELYLLAKQYFHQGGKTLDLGCGSGRDTAWLIENGYDAYGVDYTEGFVEFAKEHFPKIRDHFSVNSLPKLQGIEDESFSNIFCSAVIQHFGLDEIEDSIKTISKILKTNGKLLISYRECQNNSEDFREEGKLYFPHEEKALHRLLSTHGLNILHSSLQLEKKRGIKWITIVATKK